MNRSLVVALWGCCALAFGCSAPDVSRRESAGALDPATFAPVSELLIKRCGSLECHGENHRNFRLYGRLGRRLDPAMLPDGQKTTAEEIAANYENLVSLEPSIIREVASATATPSALTAYRKALGKEAHKGGQRIGPGSDADTCLAGWLTGSPDDAACQTAFDVP